MWLEPEKCQDETDARGENGSASEVGADGTSPGPSAGGTVDVGAVRTASGEPNDATVVVGAAGSVESSDLKSTFGSTNTTKMRTTPMARIKIALLLS